MTREPGKNSAASIRTRLLTLAQDLPLPCLLMH